MSAVMMTRSCVHCRRRYTYNPSVGRFGMVCPHCGKVQGEPSVVSTKQGETVINEIQSMILNNKKMF